MPDDGGLRRRRLQSVDFAAGPGTWMTREEAARYARCSVATIDRARASGALRSTNGGGRRIRIQRAWLDAWLLSGTLGVFALLTLTLLVLTVACLGGVIAA